MKKSLVGAIVCFVALSIQAGTITGRIVGVTDGDTVTVLDANQQQHKIRLAGIDAPEKAQPFGDRSKQNLAAMVFNKNVTVDWEKQDHYGRTVGKILIDGKDANLAQIIAGMAWWYEKYRNEQSPADQRLYEQAEQKARTQRIGLWGDTTSIPPWNFRHAKDSSQSETPCPCSGAASCTGPKGGHYCVMDSGRKKYR